MAQKQTVTEARQVTVRVADCVWIGFGLAVAAFFTVEAVTGNAMWGRYALLAAMISLTAYACSRYQISPERRRDFDALLNDARELRMVKRSQNGDGR